MNVGKGQSLLEAAAGCELPTERYLTVRVPWAYCHLHTRKDGEPTRGLTQLRLPGDKNCTSLLQVTPLESNDHAGSQRQPELPA